MTCHDDRPWIDVHCDHNADAVRVFYELPDELAKRVRAEAVPKDLTFAQALDQVLDRKAELADAYDTGCVTVSAVALAELEAEVERLREQVAWTVERCNAAMGAGFQGTPNSAVAAVCDEVARLSREGERLREALLALVEASEAYFAPKSSGAPLWPRTVDARRLLAVNARSHDRAERRGHGWTEQDWEA